MDITTSELSSVKDHIVQEVASQLSIQSALNDRITLTQTPLWMSDELGSKVDTPQVSFPDGSRFDYGVWVNETWVKFASHACVTRAVLSSRPHAYASWRSVSDEALAQGRFGGRQVVTPEHRLGTHGVGGDALTRLLHTLPMLSWS
ncbi:hypothetical protein H4Q26_002079 [Puccinia striiformis f. sp. tritici PST-130]|uniref:Uncharacterized protein n=1 Tax=Puccinia striiformis f. sp. tritici PST-78 TaxID=1165861 RepID=A0A0L0UWF2_9BASI|nr:hypothetical protein H4Q26_002079 [Puccinia striiformis f. sp. tritici PST-130]KNE91355.1 hypothetical protein PSTG_15220 [Puccinia striiformis f. sp. tritici PST-78]